MPPYILAISTLFLGGLITHYYAQRSFLQNLFREEIQEIKVKLKEHSSAIHNLQTRTGEHEAVCEERHSRRPGDNPVDYSHMRRNPA